MVWRVVETRAGQGESCACPRGAVRNESVEGGLSPLPCAPASPLEVQVEAGPGPLGEQGLSLVLLFSQSQSEWLT